MICSPTCTCTCTAVHVRLRTTHVRVQGVVQVVYTTTLKINCLSPRMIRRMPYVVHVYTCTTLYNVRVLPEYLRTKVDIILSTRVQLRVHVLYTCTRSDIFYLQDTVSCYSISVIRKYESTSVLPYCTRTVLPSLRKTFIGNFLAA